MKVIRSKEFSAARAWDASHIATLDGTSVRLHWTDQPYRWHRNDGAEVFVVLDGSVDMHYRHAGVETMVTLASGDIFFADADSEHMARPHGAARVLVIEREGSA